MEALALFEDAFLALLLLGIFVSRYCPGCDLLVVSMISFVTARQIMSWQVFLGLAWGGST
jgi:hypothetical protein